MATDYPTRDGTCVRDYIHVLDLAQAHILALRALDDGSRTYNLGNGQGYTVREVIEMAREVTGHPIPAVAGPRRPGDLPALVASSDRIRRELGWQPRYPDLRDIVQSAWDWHRVHPKGYEPSLPPRGSLHAHCHQRLVLWISLAPAAANTCNGLLPGHATGGGT